MEGTSLVATNDLDTSRFENGIGRGGLGNSDVFRHGKSGFNKGLEGLLKRVYPESTADRLLTYMYQTHGRVSRLWKFLFRAV